MMKIPYEEPLKRRGRKPGSKNRPGHKAGRPSNGNQCGAAAPMAQEPAPTGTNPGRPLSRRIAYDTPMPCTDGHHCPGNGRPQICKEPLPNLPAKPMLRAPGHGVMAAVAQAGLNSDLITAEELLKETQYLALSDIAEWPDCPESFKNAPVGFRRSISSLQVTKTVHTSKDGDITETEQTKFTLWSKNTAHDQLHRYHGLYAKDKVPINAQFNQYNQMNINHGWDLSRLSGEELETMLALAAKAEGEIVELEAVGAR